MRIHSPITNQLQVDDEMKSGAQLFAYLKQLLKLYTRQRDKAMMLSIVEEVSPAQVSNPTDTYNLHSPSLYNFSETSLPSSTSLSSASTNPPTSTTASPTSPSSPTT